VNRVPRCGDARTYSLDAGGHGSRGGTGRHPKAAGRRTGPHIVLSSHGHSTRLIPLLDVVAPDDDPAAVADRWGSLAGAVEEPSVVVYLAASKAVRELPLSLATSMMSAGPDVADRGALLAGVPVSPLETTSLERLARAVAIAVRAPALLDYPVPVQIWGDPAPRRLIEHLIRLDLTPPGHSPLLHVADTITVRRPLTETERSRLRAEIQRLVGKTKAPGWERDLIAEIGSLGDAIDEAVHEVGMLLNCPLCGTAADPRQVDRADDVFMIACRSCGGRWGLERCGGCGGRIPVVEPESVIRNPEVVGPGWVERIYGRDALASPCWARTVPYRYVCPECRSCALASSPEGSGCIRCQSDAMATSSHRAAESYSLPIAVAASGSVSDGGRLLRWPFPQAGWR